MNSIKVNCGNIEISNDNKICIIAGPCQLETEQHAMDMAGQIKEITKKFNLGFIIKHLLTKRIEQALKVKEELAWKHRYQYLIKLKKNWMFQF